MTFDIFENKNLKLNTAIAKEHEKYHEFIYTDTYKDPAVYQVYLGVTDECKPVKMINQ